MKKRILFLACILATLTACKKDDPTPGPGTNKLSCTMAIYGCGGGGTGMGVDVDAVNELIEAMRYGPTEKVNVVSQYNFVTNDPNLKYANGTAVMCLKAKNTTIDFIDSTIFEGKGCKTVADSDAVRIKAIDAKLKEMVDAGAYSLTKLNGTTKEKLYRPEDISKFLDRAAKEFPADHYLFCLSGHGGAWDAKDDREITKAVSYDDNFKDASESAIGITAKNLAAGINGSTIASKIPVVYFNACQMNFLENICEYAACPVPYALISFKITNGTSNNIVLEELNYAEGNTVSDLTNALLAAYEKIYKNKSCDISLIDIKGMKTAAAGIKDFVPLLKDDYLADKAYYNSTMYNLHCPDDKEVSCNKDFSEFLDVLSKEENLDPEIKTVVNKIKADIKAAVVKTFYGSSCIVKQNLLTGVKFIGKDAYAKSRKDYAASYDNNAFYKLTGWNTLFEVFEDEINDSGDDEDEE